MNTGIFRFVFTFALSGLLASGCNKWEDHTAVGDPSVGKDLFQQINEDPNLKTFADLLTKTGFDKVIASSKTFTVFAPVNASLATIDPAILADKVKLRLFVGNHITNQLHLANGSVSSRLQMLNGKYNNLAGTKIDDAEITTANKYAKNGLLHIINKAVPALPSAWEFIQTGPGVPANQRNFLLSDTDTAGVHWFTGFVSNLGDESGQFTFLLMENDAWDAELTRFKPFFVIPGSADSTNLLSARAVLKDLVADTVYIPGVLPDTIVSKFNTKVGINKTEIAQTVKVSNGIIYIMRRVEVKPSHKFKPIIIEGEDYLFASADRRNNTYFRDKRDPNTGREFRDVVVFNHGVSEFYLGYQVSNVPALKYRAYWVALQDNINNFTGTFNQKLGIGSPRATQLPYTTVQYNKYDEAFVGEFEQTAFSPFLSIYLVAANSTNANANMITADYIRLEPVF